MFERLQRSVQFVEDIFARDPFGAQREERPLRVGGSAQRALQLWDGQLRRGLPIVRTQRLDQTAHQIAHAAVEQFQVGITLVVRQLKQMIQPEHRVLGLLLQRMMIGPGFQVRNELLPQGGQQFDQHHVAFDHPELRLDETPRRIFDKQRGDGTCSFIV